MFSHLRSRWVTTPFGAGEGVVDAAAPERVAEPLLLGTSAGSEGDAAAKVPAAALPIAGEEVEEGPAGVCR